MGQAALKDSARFDPSRVAGRYESLFADLSARGGLRGSLHRARGSLVGGAMATTEAMRRVRMA